MYETVRYDRYKTAKFIKTFNDTGSNGVGNVYIAYNPSTHKYKIGCSRCIIQRIKTLETATEDGLIIVAVLTTFAYRKAEEVTHDILFREGYKPIVSYDGRTTEWYTIDPSIVISIFKKIAKKVGYGSRVIVLNKRVNELLNENNKIDRNVDNVNRYFNRDMYNTVLRIISVLMSLESLRM